MFIFSVSVLANDISQLIAEEVTFKIFVNQEEKTLNDKVILINNKTYVPLREVGEILQLDVEWSEENQSISINSKKETPKDNNQLLYPFKDNDLWGYMDKQGNVVIEAIYLAAYEFSEDLAVIKNENERYGYINLKGEIVIPCKYYEAYNFSEGFAVVQERRYSKNERPPITDTTGSYIYINKSGENVFNKEYAYAEEFSEGYAQVISNNGDATYINKNGDIATNLNFISRSKFYDNYAIVRTRNEGYAIIDKNFNPTYLRGYDNVYGTNGGYVVAAKQGKYGVIDIEGNTVIDFQYEYLSEYSDGLFIFRLDNRSGQGYIDINNNIVIPAKKFKSLNSFKNGLAIVSKLGEGQNYGVINKNAEYIIEPEYKEIRCLNNSIFVCLTNLDKYKYFDLAGNEIDIRN